MTALDSVYVLGLPSRFAFWQIGMSIGTSYIIPIENQQIPYVLLPFPFYIFTFGIVVYTKQWLILLL